MSIPDHFNPLLQPVELALIQQLVHQSRSVDILVVLINNGHSCFRNMRQRQLCISVVLAINEIFLNRLLVGFTSFFKGKKLIGTPQFLRVFLLKKHVLNFDKSILWISHLASVSNCSCVYLRSYRLNSRS